MAPPRAGTANPRRRHSRRRYIIPALSAVSAFLLFLFTTISFLAPPPSDLGHHQSRLGLRRSSVRYIALPPPLNDTLPFHSVFNVPIKGRTADRDLWSSRFSENYYGCSNSSVRFLRANVVTHSNRYLAISTSGGLNQQRTGITDAVVAARILNATLVVPKLDQKSFWKDTSDFSEIFDINWFIKSLSGDVEIVKQLPSIHGRTLTPYRMRVPRKCSDRCYKNRVLPVLMKRHVVQLTKFDYRLANKLDVDLQKLRCRVNYHALRFTDPILGMAQKLVQRMRMKSKHYVALHLRFEPDMLAFSGCNYGGGEKEKLELGAIRRRWKTLHLRNPERERRQGKCPLTPEEVGLMLRALGYGRDVQIYVASGEVYGGEQTLAPLRSLFPNVHSKETLAAGDELRPFSDFSSRMAALDFVVCDQSDVFVTNNNGNMARILAGRRRYFGHKPTVRPNAKKLYRVFLNRENMTWEAFASGIRTHQVGFMGAPMEVRPGRGEFHENPSQCICRDGVAKPETGSSSRKRGKAAEKGPPPSRESESAAAGNEADADGEDDDVSDRGGFVDTLSDYDRLMSEEPELEEMLSD